MSNNKDNIEKKKHFTCKVIIVGDSGVGKTSIISRYMGAYQENTSSTLGASFVSKNIEIGNYDIKLEIWDTAGQEKYRSISTIFYKEACICILVYDITRKDTFLSIKNYWYDTVKENGLSNMIFGVAGNKSDLYEYEKIDINEVKSYCKSINSEVVLTSAKNNVSVDELFKKVCEKFINSDLINECEDVEEEINENLEEDNKEGKIILENQSKKVPKEKNKCC